MKFKFEDKIDIINTAIAKRKNSWKLQAIAWMDFDDVSAMIRNHISVKWGQWDQEQELLPWVNRIISNQIRNIIRNIYSSKARPCINCASNNGEDLCSIYGTQCAECPLYAKWEKKKKSAHEINTAIPISEVSNELNSKLYEKPFGSVNLEESAEKLHKRMKKALNIGQYKMYEMLFIEQLSETEVAKKMGYKLHSNPSGRSRAKQIQNHKKKIISIVKQILSEEGLESL